MVSPPLAAKYHASVLASERRGSPITSTKPLIGLAMPELASAPGTEVLLMSCSAVSSSSIGTRAYPGRMLRARPGLSSAPTARWPRIRVLAAESPLIPIAASAPVSRFL
ncbi:hypothetical protein D3C84_723490 [compost metagenome]